jgi:hypothetical protein
LSAGQRKLLNEWELWASALTLERQHGDNACTVNADRISDLALSGDHDGVANWNMNASCFDHLRRGWHVKPDTLL